MHTSACNCNCWACLQTDRRGCWFTACHTQLIFCGVRMVFGLPVAFLITADAVVLKRLTQLCTKAANGASAICWISKCAQKCRRGVRFVWFKKWFSHELSLFRRPQCHRNWNPHCYATCLQSPILLLSAGPVSQWFEILNSFPDTLYNWHDNRVPGLTDQIHISGMKRNYLPQT